MNDLTRGKLLQQIVKFAIPMTIGNLVQQLYNIVDAIVVGRVVGSEGLVAVSGRFTVMVFLTSIIIGLTMGVGVVYTQYFGAVNKIDAFAYMPVQDFGNAFDTYVAQNKGAGEASMSIMLTIISLGTRVVLV